jgi:uncharacterized membrane protein YoaK (UPF0700 family)
LAVCHGWASFVSFSRFGGFASMMTGNLLFGAGAVVNTIGNMASSSSSNVSSAGASSGGIDDVLFFSTLLASYSCGLVLYRVTLVLTRFHDSATVSAILIMCLLVATDALLYLASQHRLLMCIVAAAMGCVNAVVMVVNGHTTHVLTLQLQRAVMLAVDLLLGVGGTEAKTKQKKLLALLEAVSLITSFLAGAVVAASLVSWGAEHFQFSPIGVVFGVILSLHDCEHDAEQKKVEKAARAEALKEISDMAMASRHFRRVGRQAASVAKDGAAEYRVPSATGSLDSAV